MLDIKLDINFQFSFYVSALLAGPIVGTLGYRCMAMFAGLLSGIGLATASVSPNIYVVFVTHGILPGLYKKLLMVFFIGHY